MARASSWRRDCSSSVALVPEEELLEDPPRGDGRGETRAARTSVVFVSFSGWRRLRGSFRSPFLIVSERSPIVFFWASGEFFSSSSAAAFSRVSEGIARPGVGSEEEMRLGGL